MNKVIIITVVNILSQVLSMLGFLLVTKAVSPEFIGQYMVYLSIAAVISIVGTGFYEQALYIERDKNESPSIIGNVLVFALLSSSLILLLLSVLSVNHALLISFFVFASGVKVLARTFAVINEKVLELAIWECLTVILVPLIIFILYSSYDLLSSDVMIKVNAYGFFAISCFFFWYFILRNISVHYIIKSINLNNYWRFIKRYKNLPMQKMVAELVNSLTIRSPTIIIEKVYSSEMAGFYGASLRIILSPISVFSSTISQLFTTRVVNDRSKTKDNLLSNLKLTIVMGLIISLLAYVFSELFIVFMFGEEYKIAGDIIKCLIPYMFALVSFSPFFSVFVIAEKQKELLFFNVIILSLTLISYAVGAYFNNVYSGIILFSFLSLIIHVAMIFRVYLISLKLSVN